MENLLTVGLSLVLIFMPYLVARRKPAGQPFFIPQPSIRWDSNEYFPELELLENALTQQLIKWWEPNPVLQRLCCIT
jgi:hypothetical protein